jgi:hypothetical protein
VTASRYAALTRDQLARLVPELLLMGQLIDRSGMAWCISAFGREEMAQIAIEEWVGASPVYTRRMQRALGYEPEVEGRGDVVTIVKGLQLDIGAPPQFMDFRYTIRDPWHAEFQLDHCGALLDVEPMGDDYVRSMCHDIEDPTFDATAVATNPRAQMRPVHRPPRAPAGRQPHCSWTIVIDESHPVVQPEPAYHEMMRTRAASLELTPIDTGDEGASDYAGALLSDIDFTAFSHSALVRVADEVALQMHLLNLSFGLAVRSRATSVDQAVEICLKQLTGIAGIGAERLHRLLALDDDEAAALRVLELHPLLNPAAYVTARIADGVLSVEPGPAHEDGSWISLCGPGRTAALEAVAWAISPELGVEVTGDADRWQLRFVRRSEAAPEPPEVAVTRFSKGAAFEFQPRESLPLFPV